jgi:hypothetical protein
MRFMMLLIRKGHETEAGTAARKMEYNKSLQKAGVLLGLDELSPPSKGARVSYADGTANVTERLVDGTTETIAGYWIIQVRSREEAVEWARRAPMANNEIIDVRQMEEYPNTAAKG